MTKKQFSAFKLCALGLLLLLFGFYLGSQKKSDSIQVEKVNNQIPTNASTKFPKSNYINSGILVTYDPVATDSRLKNQGFKPNTWYLVTDWEDATKPPSIDKSIELRFLSNSFCVKPKDSFSEERVGHCNTFKGWGYGDSVTIFGDNVNKSIDVDRMEIVSSLLVGNKTP